LARECTISQLLSGFIEVLRILAPDLGNQRPLLLGEAEFLKQIRAARALQPVNVDEFRKEYIRGSTAGDDLPEHRVSDVIHRRQYEKRLRQCIEELHIAYII